jgi:hypothetical protein
MINETNQIVKVILPIEDTERIEALGKSVSEFCRDAVHERLRIIEMAKENTIKEWMYEDSEEDVPDIEEIIINPDPVHDQNPDWSKFFARV